MPTVWSVEEQNWNCWDLVMMLNFSTASTLQHLFERDFQAKKFIANYMTAIARLEVWTSNNNKDHHKASSEYP